MGYLDNAEIVVEAILTKKGREIMSKGGTLNITKFALADDEIDYTLWQEDHPLGTNYYGSVIEAMPVLEATPDETQTMRYKLVSIRDKNTTTMPIMSGLPSVLELGRSGDTTVIAPTTRYFTGDTFGYTAILHNSNYAYLEVENAVNQSVIPSIPTFLRDDQLNQSVTVVGKTFRVITKDIRRYLTNSTANYVSTQITIIGNDTGATRSITLRVTGNLTSAQTSSGS